MAYAPENPLLPNLGTPLHPVEANQDAVLDDPLEAAKPKDGLHRHAAHLGLAAVKGAVISVAMYIPEAFQTWREMGRNNKAAISSINEHANVLKESADTTTEEHRDHTRNKWSFRAMRWGWGALAFPAYQVADDVPGYFIYTQLQDHIGTAGACGLVGAGTIGVAAGLGLFQRRVEKRRAELMNVEAVDDDSDNMKYFLDATVMSAPWQVFRKANAKPDKDNETRQISLTPSRRVVEYGAAYGVANTALYAASEALPVGDWTGFGLSLLAVTALTGAGFAVRDKHRERRAETENTQELTA